MPLGLAFEDNRPHASNLHRRSSEQVKSADTSPSVLPPAKRRLSPRYRPHPWKCGTYSSRALWPLALRCKHLAASGGGTVPHPGGCVTHDERQRSNAGHGSRLLGPCGDRRRPCNEPTLPMSPPALCRTTNAPELACVTGIPVASTFPPRLQTTHQNSWRRNPRARAWVPTCSA